MPPRRAYENCHLENMCSPNLIKNDVLNVTLRWAYTKYHLENMRRQTILKTLARALFKDNSL